MAKRASIFFAAILCLCSQAGAQQVVPGDQGLEVFGWNVASAGDVNGDGFKDVVIGAPYYDNGEADEGRVVVYHGSATGIGSSPAWSFELNYSQSDLGSAVASAGGVNGDGFDDLLVGASRVGPRLEGTVYLFLGSATGLSTTPNWTYQGVSGIENFGRTVASAGDVNGDGFKDIVVGGPSFANGELAEGRALLFLGSAAGLSGTPAWSYESNQANALFGWSVASAGDTNGDGFSDVVIGALQERNPSGGQGRAYIFLGGASGLSTNPTWTFEGDQTWAQLGVSVSSAGDVNRDGFADVLVGEHGYSIGRAGGRTLLFLGSATGPRAAPAWSPTGTTNGGQLGFTVSSAGDVNKDGYLDVLIGAPRHRNNGVQGGASFLYLGSRDGLATIPDWSYFGRDSSNFGNSVAAAGDLNGDGYGDIIIGAPYDNGTPSQRGAAYLFLGDPSQVMKINGASQCSGCAAPSPASPTPTRTATPTSTPTVTLTPSPIVGGATGSSVGTATPTPTATLTAAPGGADALVTPVAAPTVPGISNISCVSGTTSTTLTALVNPAYVGCAKNRPSRRRTSASSWALKSASTSGSAAMSCSSTGREISSFNVTAKARPNASDCRRKYSPITITASWRQGQTPKVAVKRSAPKCSGKRRTLGGVARKVSIKRVGTTGVISGRMRVARVGCSGRLSGWQPFEFTVVGQ
jgi:hypothetical protein